MSAKMLKPEVGVKVGRPEFVKARVCYWPALATTFIKKVLHMTKLQPLTVKPISRAASMLLELRMAAVCQWSANTTENIVKFI